MYPKNKSNKWLTHNEKGMTLVEILMTIFILGLIITQIFGVLIWNSNNTSKGIETQTNQEQFRVVNLSIIEDIMYAKNIVIKNNTNEDIISYTKLNGEPVVYSFRENDGLYRVNGTNAELLFEGKKYDSLQPAVYKENSGLIRINYSATKIKSVMYLSVKPRIVPTP